MTVTIIVRCTVMVYGIGRVLIRSPSRVIIMMMQMSIVVTIKVVASVAARGRARLSIVVTTGVSLQIFVDSSSTRLVMTYDSAMSDMIVSGPLQVRAVRHLARMVFVTRTVSRWAA